MGFKYRRPSINIGGVRFSRNKNGISISSKTLLGGRKTYNTATGKTTTTYKTGIKGLSYQTVSGGNSKSKTAKYNAPAVKSNISDAEGQITGNTTPADKGKKPIFKRWWFWLIVIILFIGITSPQPDRTTVVEDDTPKSVDTEVEEQAQEDAAGVVAEETEGESEAPFRIILSWDEVGPYGEERIINADTDMPMSYIAFSLPAGTYEVKNLNTNGGSQVTVYSGVEFDGQWEQLVSEDCDDPIVIMGGEEAKVITIKDGQFVKLSDNSTNIEFVRKQ